MIGSAVAFGADDPAADSYDDHREQNEFKYPRERADQPLGKRDPAKNSQRRD